MKIKDILQRIQSLYSKGVQSDDTRLSNRHIYNVLMSVRSTLITQQIKKKQLISAWNYQTLPCVELISVPSYECPCITPIGCEIVRSKYKLPAPLNGLNGHIIHSVTSIDRKLKIDEIKLNAVNYQKGNRYTTSKVNYFIHQGYLYLSTPTKMKVVTITALFEDPIKANQFKGMCDEQNNNICDYLEQEFPLDKDLETTAIQMASEELINIFPQMIEDISNNTRDSHIQQSK